MAGPPGLPPFVASPTVLRHGDPFGQQNTTRPSLRIRIPTAWHSALLPAWTTRGPSAACSSTTYARRVRRVAELKPGFKGSASPPINKLVAAKKVGYRGDRGERVYYAKEHR